MTSLRIAALLIVVARFSSASQDLAPATAAPDAEEKYWSLHISGQYKDYMAIEKAPAPASFQVEKVEHFPEDYTQRLLAAPLPLPIAEEIR